MMSESQQEETAVSVVQASPDVRPVLLPTPLVRISLRSLQAMPGYTSSPVLEDGAGIVAYDTVDGEDFLVVNAYKAGTQYRFGGGQGARPCRRGRGRRRGAGENNKQQNVAIRPSL